MDQAQPMSLEVRPVSVVGWHYLLVYFQMVMIIINLTLASDQTMTSDSCLNV